MQTWGLVTDATAMKIYALYTEGYSVEYIADKLKLTAKVVAGHIKNPTFQADLKLLQDELDFRDLSTPKGRVKRLQSMALDVLADTLKNGSHKKQVDVAFDILDRAGDLPRRSQVDQTQTLVSAAEMAMLAGVMRELGSSIAKASLEQAMHTIDVTPLGITAPERESK